MEKNKYSYSADRENSVLPSRLRDLISSAKDVKAIANLLNVSPQAVNQYKLGISYPKTENLIKIADYYGISVDYLLNLTDVPNRDTSIQAVNEVTGLSAGAIVKLHDMKAKNDSLCDIISAMIEDSNAEFFLSLWETLISFDGTDAGKDFVSVDICGKELNLSEDNHLKAVLQTKMIENIPQVAMMYRNLRKYGGNTDGERS